MLKAAVKTGRGSLNDGVCRRRKTKGADEDQAEVVVAAAVYSRMIPSTVV